ncbi:MAG: hypothetical protein K8T25_16255 [Planctomycetia bacterium]|nr:hypothetical protein [Planctomycetia bacterium]
MRSTRISFVVSVVLLFASASSVLSQDATKKNPVPDEAAQAEATKNIKEVFGDEYSKAKTAADKSTLAKKLLQMANESKDDRASKYVLLKLARDIAAQASDGQTGFQAIDTMGEAYQIDALEMASVVLTKLATAPQKLAQHKSVAEEALKLVNQAVVQDNFMRADQFGRIALGEAKKARNKELLVQIQDRVAEVVELSKTYEGVKTALVTLKTTPDDPAANSTVGKYLCFVKGDWSKGVPMLSLGKEEALKQLALNDLKGAASPAEYVKLGDAWWTLAEKEPRTTKKQIQAHAGDWYKKALPDLSGLMKIKTEKRLAECSKNAPPEVAATTESVVGEYLLTVTISKSTDGRFPVGNRESSYRLILRPGGVGEKANTYNGNVVGGAPGKWTADNKQVRFRFDDSRMGQVILDIGKDGNNVFLEGVHAQPNFPGVEWTWKATRGAAEPVAAEARFLIGEYQLILQEMVRGPDGNEHASPPDNAIHKLFLRDLGTAMELNTATRASYPGGWKMENDRVVFRYDDTKRGQASLQIAKRDTGVILEGFLIRPTSANRCFVRAIRKGN